MVLGFGIVFVLFSFVLVLGIEPRDALPLSYIPSPFYFFFGEVTQAGFELAVLLPQPLE